MVVHWTCFFVSLVDIELIIAGAVLFDRRFQFLEL